MLLTFSSAVAQLTTYTDRSTFEAAAGTTITEDFASFTTEDAFHTTAVDAGDFTIFIDASKKSWNFIDIPSHQDSWANIDGTTSMNLFMTRGEKLVFTFDAPVSAFGADFRGMNDGRNRVDFLINGDSVTPPITGGEVNSFFGITSTVEFTQVEIHADYGQNDSFGIDNVTYNSASAVPEPGSIFMLSLACCGFGLLYYRLKKPVPAPTEDP